MNRYCNRAHWEAEAQRAYDAWMRQNEEIVKRYDEAQGIVPVADLHS